MMSSAGSPVQSIDPVSGRIWATYEASGPDAVRAAVERARCAQTSWAATAVGDRARALERFRRSLADERSRVAETISRETGKPRSQALFEVFSTAEFARFCAKNVRKVLRPDRYRSMNLAIWRKKIEVIREPLGVVAVIAPWNYPLLLTSSPVVAALVFGNTVILKPSEFTPTTGLELGDLLHQAGFPEDAIQVLPGGGETGSALLEAEVDKVFFIGSEATGRRVAARCAERMIPCVLELGGSDPAVVLEDADLRNAAKGLVWGRFSNAGQSCVAPKRLIVVDAVYDRFLSEMKREVESLRVGTDIGPLIRPVQKERLEIQYRDAIDRGANVAARLTTSMNSESFFPPTILVDVERGMKVVSEETFGPLLPIIRVRNEDEAVSLANESRYGLSASIWTRDLARARRLARRIDAGAVTINDSLIIAGLADVPYGGTKASGFGRMHGLIGLLEFVRTRSLVIDPVVRWPEPYWDTGSEQATRGVDAFVELTHGRGFLRRLGAALRVVRDLYLRPGDR